MTINGRKIRLKKNIRRTLAALEATAVIAGLTYCAAVLFFWTLGIDLI